MISRGQPLQGQRRSGAALPGMKGSDEQMRDSQILLLLQRRDESALKALSEQYGKACRRQAKKILGNDEDADEVFNDALLQIWNAVPPAQPKHLGAYLHACVKRLALNRLEQRGAAKRGGGQHPLSLDALPEQMHPESSTVEELMDRRMLFEAVNRFIGTLPDDAAAIFVHYYGNNRSIREIAEAFGFSQSKVAVTLMRTRRKLWSWLEKEGRL